MRMVGRCLVFLVLCGLSLWSFGEKAPLYSWDFTKVSASQKQVHRFPGGGGKYLWTRNVGQSSRGEWSLINSPKLSGRNQVPRIELMWPEMTLEGRFLSQVEFAASKRRTNLIYYMGQSWSRRFLEVYVTPDSRIGVELRARTDDGKKLLKSFNMVGQPAKLIPGQWFTVRLAIKKGGNCQIWLNGALYEEAKATADMTDLKGPYPQDYPLLILGTAFPGDKNERALNGRIQSFKVWQGILDPTGVVPVTAKPQAPVAEPNLVLGRCQKAPVLDGRLDEPCWQATEWSRPFKVYDVPGPLLGSMLAADEKFVKTAATMALTTDGKSLFLGVKCPIPEGVTCRVKCQKNGGSLWNDDCVEFFLKPFKDKPHFFQYGINADGFMTGIKHASAGSEVFGFKTRAQASGQRNEKAFTLELAVPLDELELQDIGQAMGMTFNVTRTGPTVGGASSWAPVGRVYATPDRFGKLLPMGRKGYFLAQVNALEASLASMAVSEELKSQVRPQFKSVHEKLGREGDEPSLWDAHQLLLQNLRNALTRLAMAGRPFLVWATNPWLNHQPNLPVPMTAKPLERIRLRTVRNSRVLYGFLFSNLGELPMMPRIKVVESPLPKLLFFNSRPDKKSEAYELANRTTFREGLPMKDSSGKVVPDPLAPLVLNSVIRCQGGNTVPLWMEIKTDGMAPGVYHAKVMVRPTYQSIPPQVIDLELTVEDIDLDEIKLDSFTYSYVKNPAFYRLAHDYDLNIIYGGSPGQGILRNIYPGLDKDGKVIAEPDFSGMDYQIDQSLANGFKASELKVFFFLSYDTGYYRSLPREGKRQLKDFGSEAWKRAIKYWLDSMEKHLKTKYGMSMRQLILNPEDESTGDPEDPKSPMGIALNSVRWLKEACPEVRTMLNPYLEKSEKVDYHKMLTYLAKHTDIIELYAPRLHKHPDLADIIRKHGNFEIWVYGILGNSTSPLSYRHLYWENWRCGLEAVCAYWHFDSHSGGDGMNPFDWSYNPKNTTDYGVVYVDAGSDQILPSRRSEAWYQGFVDFRLAAICRQRIQNAQKAGKDVTAWQASLADITKRGMSADMMGLDSIQQELIDLALKIK